MTLDFLRTVQTQLTEQYKGLVSTQVPDEKLTLLHCNGIEVRGALQLIAQLIQQEQTMLAAPPGAMGPGL